MAVVVEKREFKSKMIFREFTKGRATLDFDGLT